MTGFAVFMRSQPGLGLRIPVGLRAFPSSLILLGSGRTWPVMWLDTTAQEGDERVQLRRGLSLPGSLSTPQLVGGVLPMLFPRNACGGTYTPSRNRSMIS